MATTGTYSLQDLYVDPDGITIADFGEAEAAQVVREELAAHNVRYQDMTNALMVTTTERTLTYGSAGKRTMRRFDDNGRLATKKSGFKGGTYGLPYDQFGDALGWNTLDFVQTTTVAFLAREIIEMQDADVLYLFDMVQSALFGPTNYEWYDYLTDNAELQVKRLLNGDGAPIPANRAGAKFGAEHTHYLGSDGWTEEAIDEQIKTVREHDLTGNIIIYINASNVSNIAGLSKFMPARKDRVIYGANERVADVTLDNGRDDNRVIGLWDGLYDVQTKPWMIAGYTFVYDTQGPKPLTMRLPTASVQNGLRLVGDIDIYPLRANYYARRVGVGVGERTNGAICWMGGDTYEAPDGLI